MVYGHKLREVGEHLGVPLFHNEPAQVKSKNLPFDNSRWTFYSVVAR